MNPRRNADRALSIDGIAPALRGGAIAAALVCACSSLVACEREQPEPARMPPAPPPLVPPAPAEPVAPPPPPQPAAIPEQPVAPVPPRPPAAQPASLRATPREPSEAARDRDPDPAPRGREPASPPEAAPPSPPAPTSQTANKPAPSEPPRPAAEPEPPRKKVVVPSTDHVRVDVPNGMQALLDADPRMQPWLANVIGVIDDCYSRERSRVQDAAGTIQIALVMHANARPDADVKSVPPQLGGVVACATPQLMRARPPLFTGPEGERHTVKVRFTR